MWPSSHENSVDRTRFAFSLADVNNGESLNTKSGAGILSYGTGNVRATGAETGSTLLGIEAPTKTRMPDTMIDATLVFSQFLRPHGKTPFMIAHPASEPKGHASTNSQRRSVTTARTPNTIPKNMPRAPHNKVPSRQGCRTVSSAETMDDWTEVSSTGNATATGGVGRLFLLRLDHLPLPMFPAYHMRNRIGRHPHAGCHSSMRKRMGKIQMDPLPNGRWRCSPVGCRKSNDQRRSVYRPERSARSGLSF